METEEIDLYEVLGIARDASKTEVKKAYHKAALTSHPDKVSEEERPHAEIRFKTIQRAYEILYEEDTRHMYDTHGMSAFDASRGGPSGMPDGVDLDDILQQMFGMGMGGGPPPGFGGGGMGGFPDGPGGAAGGRKRKGRDEETSYDVTLEELYKGKTTRFASTKQVICQTCKGSGGKEKAKTHKCTVCDGKGTRTGLRTVGPGLVTQETTQCSNCHGGGQVYKEKDRCKRCKGSRTHEQRKVLELYIPRGSKSGDRIVLPGEADQQVGQEPGDIVFVLKEEENESFDRVGNDLRADIEVELIEALTGFERVVLKHLDGRGISISHPSGKILRPNQVLKVAGEGMPIKRSEARGDLYLVVDIKFPEDGWMNDETKVQRLKEMLPKLKEDADLKAEVVDEVEYDADASIEDFGGAEGGGGGWEDADDDEGAGGPQCAQQ
ncbi:putative DnaJ domain protein [Aulographum hederae CBS 113979]|uniref:Putative DnaJ domain protein n=1 Tax=Aulographum hederae CBS 113979 TaxID=1176131 RepID=A0A6G1GSJ1_9PEZI|nr:putative DnaJ domain protein [Aulographum hederae CBS 113979]